MSFAPEEEENILSILDFFVCIEKELGHQKDHNTTLQREQEWKGETSTTGWRGKRDGD